MKFKTILKQNNKQRGITRCLWLIAYSLWLILPACSPADNSWQRIQDNGVIVVGLYPTFPPFENGDTGELHGIDVDLARAIGEHLGVEVRFSYLGYDGLYDALATEQVDVLLSALVIDLSKTKDFAYTRPYFNAGQFLVTHQDTAAIQTQDDLGNRVVAVELGSEGHVQAIQWERRVPNLTIQPLNTPDDALWVVLQKEADAAVVDQVSGRLYIRNAPELQLLEKPITVEPYAAVVRLDDQTLLEKLDDTLAEMEDSGQLDTIIGRWLDQ
ncbi:MAG: amino acid ABC transporter substrate-binding protein [Anaerolineales bacterium]|nr:amino acid ABC transporter substrate-binding protein [Anaerolineales bacterium]